MISNTYVPGGPLASSESAAGSAGSSHDHCHHHGTDVCYSSERRSGGMGTRHTRACRWESGSSVRESRAGRHNCQTGERRTPRRYSCANKTGSKLMASFSADGSLRDDDMNRTRSARLNVEKVGYASHYCQSIVRRPGYRSLDGSKGRGSSTGPHFN
jgi:hypothetical protein